MGITFKNNMAPNNETEKVTKLPQNIQHLLMEIGEKSVLFKLFLLTKDTEWEVYQNLTEQGCDIVINNMADGNNRIKIEVKTRQRLHSTSNKKHFNYPN